MILMGVRYAWSEETPFLMYIYVEAPWTWKDYNDAMKEALSLIQQRDHPCATIVDASKMGSLPIDGNMLQIFLNIEKIAPLNLVVSVIVGAPYIVIVFLNMVMQLRPRTKQILLFASTPEEAREKILKRFHQPQSENPD
jgi:hypothetical protein